MFKIFTSPLYIYTLDKILKMHTVTNETIAQQSLFVKMVMMAWQTENARVDELLANLTNQQLLQETAPGRNTGIYLLGHLTATNDNLFKLLGIGTRLYPELDEPFLNRPDKSGLPIPSV